jgi:hypothetical protein
MKSLSTFTDTTHYKASPNPQTYLWFQRCKAHATIGVLSESLTRYGVRTLLPPLARIAAILDLQGHRLPAWH